ncbi:MAG: sigma-54-dependent Fis family transcriptional regulator [Rubrivivax sp.]|nr:sigma-54-dependent Fis family transcriptional regulator [Rubrivivax sp.]
MSLVISPERQLAHAQAMRARGSALPPEGMPGPEILDSWVRCMRAGLDAARGMTPPVVVAADLAQRRERWARVRRLAQGELETLAQQIAGSNYLLAYADPDGVILDLYQDNRFAMSADAAGIVPGSCWSEAVAGTNGLGTALAHGGAVAVTGLEHYFLGLGQISCTAAPVRDASGEVVGVLDASSYFESRQRHTQALVQMAATHIENRLLVQQMAAHWVLAVHPRSEYLGTLSAGLLAFDEQGRLLCLNARGQQLLVGLQAVPGVQFDELFDEPFALASARLARQREVSLRDRLGSVLGAACISRPRFASLAGARAAPAAVVAAATAASAAIPATPAPAAGSHQTLVQQHHTSVQQDHAVQAVYAQASRAARWQVPVLIQGETGTGKELLARHVHDASGRRGDFVAVNCGAIPAELFEAELFGYAGGAYTGARREGHAGLIASADGGTLLLDEIRELPLTLQAGLLRFLDDQQVRPVGGTQSRRVDVQLVAATHADLDAAVAARSFREDLLYRLNTVRLCLPPLRERQDFAACVQALLRQLDSRASLEPAAIERLRQHRWPGNFRELRSVLTRALLAQAPEPAAVHGASLGPRLTAEQVAAVLPPAAAQSSSSRMSSLQGFSFDVPWAAASPRAGHGSGADVRLGALDERGGGCAGLREQSGELVRQALQRHGGSVSQTARALGISRTTVYRYLRPEAG